MNSGTDFNQATAWKAVFLDDFGNIDIYTSVQKQETAGADSEHRFSTSTNSRDGNVWAQSA